MGFGKNHLDRVMQSFHKLRGKAVGMKEQESKKALIAERHAGSITARSTPGKGSTFVVAIPLKQFTSPGRLKTISKA
jgi:light-regulated signal transduction histidine kinase (bacteriophytochrome)